MAERISLPQFYRTDRNVEITLSTRPQPSSARPRKAAVASWERISTNAAVVRRLFVLIVIFGLAWELELRGYSDNPLIFPSLQRVVAVALKNAIF